MKNYFIEQYRTNANFAHRVNKNVQAFNVNLKELLKTDEFFADVTIGIFSGDLKTKQLEAQYKLWQNYNIAHNETKHIIIKDDSKEFIDDLIFAFKSKVEGEYFIPLSEVEDEVIIQYHRGQFSVVVQYLSLMAKLEHYYDVSQKDFLNKFTQHKNKQISDALNFNPDEAALARSQSPLDNINAAKFMLLNQKISVGDVEYISYWRHLLDTDFCEVSNNSQTILSYYQREETSVEFQVFNLFNQAFFKEISQIPHFNGEKPESIQCLLAW